MTLVGTPVETLDFVRVTGVATNVSTETAIASTDVVNAGINPGNRPVVVKAILNITAGAGTTAVVVNCRQGVGTGGTQVGASVTVTLAAGASGSFSVVFRDTSGVPQGGTAYTITVTQTGGTAAGTVNVADVEVTQ